MFGTEFLFILLVFFGAGPTAGNDVLDMIPTDSYWLAKKVTPTVEQLQRDAAPDKKPQNVDKLVKDLAADDFKTRDDAKKQLEQMGPEVAPLLKPALDSKDPEVAAVAATIMKQFSDKGRERAVRRLMAIRTLGERKEKAALPLLKTLVDSRELFVSDYALRAAAQIEGNKLTRIDHRKEVAADLRLIPRGTGIVGQVTGLPSVALTLDKVVDQALDPANANQFGMMAPGGKAPDKKQLLARLTKKLLEVVDKVGDLRIDGVTFGVSENIGPRGGWAIIALRGKYDAPAMLAAIKAAAGEDLKASREGNIDVVELAGEFTMIMPSNDQLIFVPSDRREDKGPIVEQLLAVLKGGKGEFEENKELVALMKTIDTTGPAWLAARLNADMRKEKMFEAFDSITLSSKIEKDGVAYSLTGQGTDADKVKESADALTAGIQGAIGQIKPMVAQMKSMQAMVDVLESMKVATEGKTATLTGQIKPESMTAAIGSAAPMMLMGLSDDADTEIEQGIEGK